MKLPTAHPALRTVLRTFLRIGLYGLLLVSVLTTAGVWLLDRTLEPEKLRVDLEHKLSDYLQRPVTIGRVSWQWSPRPILFGIDVRVTEEDGRLLASSPEVRVYPRLKHLLGRQVFVQGLGLHGATVILRRSADGATNIGRLCSDIRSHTEALRTAETSRSSFVLRAIRLTRVRFEFVDEGLRRSPLQTVLVADGSFDLPAEGGPVAMKLSADVLTDRQRGRVDVTGSLGARISLAASSRDIPLAILADHEPWLSRIDSRLAGTASLLVTSTATRWSVDGRSRPAEFLSVLRKPALAVDFKLRSDGPSSLRATVALPKTAGEIRASAPGLAAPAIAAQARFSRFDVSEVQSALSRLPGARGSRAGPGRWSLASRWEIGQAAYRGARAATLTAQASRDPDGNWRAEAATPGLTFRGESFAVSTAAISYQGGALSIPSLGFAGLGGRGVLGLAFDPGGSAVLGRRFEFTWHVADLDSSRLLDLLQTRPLTTGRLRSSGRLRGDRNELRPERITGSFEVGLATGIIAGLPGVVKVLSSLNVRSLLRTIGRDNVEGLPFRVAAASFTLSGGVLRTAVPAALNSDTLDIGIRGSVDLTMRTIQADMVIQFLTMLDEVVKMIPGLGHILIGRRKSMLPIWVKLRGPLDDPAVTIQPVKTFRKGVWRALQGVFTLPESAFSALSDAAQAK